MAGQFSVRFHSAGTGRRVVAVAGAAALVLAGTASVASATSVGSVSVTGGTGTWTDTSLTPNRVYARSGQKVTFGVTTDTSTSCVVVTDASGAVVATDKSGSSSVTFVVTAGAGDGTQVLTFTGYKNVNNGNGSCSGTTASRTASYVKDNTGPVVSPVLTPAAVNGWNNRNTTVSWTATDPDADTTTVGSGVQAQPTASATFQQNGVYALTAPGGVADRVGNTGAGSGTLKIDKAAPSISGTRTPAANGFGWNNSPVAVSFSCADQPATDSSGLAAPGCPGTSTVGNATDSTKDVTGGSVTGSVSDVAGNTSSATVGPINVDTVAPTLAGAPTTSPNTNGWYRQDVTVHWTAGDARSGVVPATAPGDATLTGEGSNLSASASVSDKAGNTKSATSSPVKIDRTAPLTSISGTSDNWTSSGSVTVNLSADDALSQVASTTYTVDGGTTQTGTSFALTTEGDHIITYSSTDKADNVEVARTAHVKIDRTAPSIGHGFTPSSYTDSSWTNASQVTVTFTCTDGGSGVASCSSPVDVTTEGAAQAVTGTAKDNAGNTATDTASVSIDRTPPSLVAQADRGANGNGWYSDDVTVSFTCTDQAALSGVKTCPASESLGEGADQKVSGTAVDVAGNSASGSVAHLSVDKTAPILSGAVTTAPNSAGWYDNSVVTHWTCSDALSGIDGSCPADSTVSGEGSNLGAVATVADKAGNARTAVVAGLKVDSTPPTTTASVSSPLATGWYADKAQVTLHGSDNLSGVAKTWYSVDGGAATAYSGAFDYAAPGTHTITFWSVDGAGNTEDATASGHTVTVKVDGTKPTITGSASPVPNVHGWNNTDVTVSFTCADAESGIADCTKNTVLGTDGADQYVTGSAVDHGGNTDTSTVGPVNVDKTQPTLSGAATTAPNAGGWYRGDVTVHWTAGDPTSGVDGTTAPGDSVVKGEGSNLTAGPVSVSDLAGNTVSATLSGVKIDRTKPQISGTATTDPNGAGWYRDDVSVAWTCSDGLSGVATGACPVPATISGEGDHLSASASVSDRADNTASGSVDGVKIDRTAPSTDISAPSDWTNQAVTLDFAATDNLSGVASTFSTVNGSDQAEGTSRSFTDEGVYTVEVWSVDVADNAETHKTAVVRIDKSAPTIRHTQSPAANAKGWNNSDVRVTFTCDDTGGSGLQSCTDPVDVTTQGKQVPVPGAALDNAGNSTTDPATVSIDKIRPTISGAPDRDANGNGWYDAPVTVGFTCDDQILLSGLTSCSGSSTLVEGAGQSVTGTAVDAADNTATTTVRGLDVDLTAPVLTGAATADPNAAGWYRGDVSVAWTCSDALSGIATGTCPGNSTVTGEGEDLLATATVDDLAGNSTLASVSGLKIDSTAPRTTASLREVDSANGWYGSGVDVTLLATDSLSQVASTWYRVDGGEPQRYTGPFRQSLEGVHTVTFWSVDHAGNVEDQEQATNTTTVRVDTTAPGITGLRTPAANAFGWNNGPVTVGFTCTDAGSGVASCPDPTTVSTEGGNQSVTGQAVDNVGHTSAATVDRLAIDLTNPTLTGAATTDPNGEGWYRGAVVVRWSCSDTLSGIDGSCPADSLVTGEGADLSASRTVSDEAGNDRTATVAGLHIDTTGPVTTVSAPSDWQTTGVDLDVTATDNLSQVAATYFTVNGGATQEGRTIALPSDGTYALTFWSVDKADNEGVHGTATVKIDQAAPSISHTITPQPNAALWNNADATVHFLCGDATSGVKSCTSDTVVTKEAAGTLVMGLATDEAGNSSSDAATVNLDKSKPTIIGKADRTANANGWYKDDVTVSFACADQVGLSGIEDCTKQSTLSEGAAQSVKGTATDRAGNADSTTVSALSVDKTDPVLTGAVTAKPNGAGWYRGDVVVHWTCSDKLSGIDGQCPADSTVKGEGDNLSATATVTDLAGNATTTTVSGLKIDRTRPSTAVSVSGTPYSTGWYDSGVTVTLSASDDRSGVAGTQYAVDGGAALVYDKPFTVGKGVHAVTFWSSDAAGNVEDRTADVNTRTIRVDDRGPSIAGAATTAPNADGWYAGPVTVHFTCDDAETAIDTCPADHTLSGDGANQSVTGTAKDKAGNVASATVGPINIDQTKPAFAPYTGTTAFTVGQKVVEPTCTAADALSGLASCMLTSRTGSATSNANGVGDLVYTFTATDKAGNAASQVVTLHVGYGWAGFLQPVTNTAHDLGSASTFKAGSTVPMKFVLKDASGTVKQAAYAPLWLAPVDLGTATTTGTGISTADAGTVGGSYKYDSAQYVYTWQTPKSGAGHYYRVGVQLDSGDVYTTLIKLG